MSTEFGCGEAVELVRLGVTTGPQVHRQVIVGHRSRRRLADDRRFVADFEMADMCVELVNAVAVQSGDLASLDRPSVQSERQRLRDFRGGVWCNGDLEIQGRVRVYVHVEIRADLPSHCADPIWVRGSA